MRLRVKENLVMLREFVTEFHQTGSFFPSSPWAAQALTSQLRGDRGPLRILELGPATGSVTAKILANMHAEDHLTICEINPRFMKTLKERLRHHKAFQQHQERISFFEGAVQDLPEIVKYDAIVCALPFLNFDLPTVREIFAKLHRLSKPGTILTYYEHAGVRRWGRFITPPRWRHRLREIDGFFRELFRTHETHKTRVWRNLVPITIYSLKLPGANGSSQFREAK